MRRAALLLLFLLACGSGSGTSTSGTGTTGGTSGTAGSTTSTGGSTTGGGAGSTCNTTFSGAFSQSVSYSCVIIVKSSTTSNNTIGFEIAEGTATTPVVNFTTLFPEPFATGTYTSANVTGEEATVEVTQGQSVDSWTADFDWPGVSTNQGSFTLTVTSTGTNINNSNLMWTDPHGTLDGTLTNNSGSTLSLHIEF
jgi:hypothetical protein